MKLHVQMQIILNQTLMSNYYFNLKFLKLVKTVLASFLVLIFFSCKNSEFSDVIRLHTNTTTNQYSQIFDYEKSIVLKEAYRFGPNVETIITDKQIILVDKDFSNQIFYYDFEGELLQKIESGIGGPDEFTEISDISYDYERDILYVFSEDQYRILGLNKKGEVVENLKINTKLYVHEIEHIYDQIFVFYAAQDKMGKNQVNVYDFNSNGIKLSFLKGIFNNIFLTNETNLWKNPDQNKIYVAPYFTNYIYKINTKLEVDSIKIQNTLDLKKVSDLKNFQELKNYTFKNSENYFIGYYKESESFRSFIFYDSKHDGGKVYLKNKINGERLKFEDTTNDLLATDQDIGKILFLNDHYAYTLNSSEHYENDEELKKELIDNLNIEPSLLSDEKYSVLNIYKIKI